MDTSNLPATQSSKAVAQKTRKQSRRLIRILHDDHNFDIIAKLVDLYDRVCKSRIKPAEKYRQEYQILSALLSYAYPKLQAIESDTRVGDNIQFNINIPSPTPKNPTRAKDIAIDAVKNLDGSYHVKV